MKEKIDLYLFIRKYKDSEYVKRLFTLFKKDMKIDNSIPLDLLVDKFIDWIRFERTLGRHFVKQINEEFMILPSRVTEIGKGKLDTNTDSLLNLGCDVTVISPYANSFNSDVHKINGNLEYGAGEGLILDGNKITTLSGTNPGLLFTSLPMDDDTINAMVRCANDGYDALITAYGDNKYDNYKDMIYRLKHLKTYIKNCFNLDTKVYDSNLDRIYYNALYIKGRRK